MHTVPGVGDLEPQSTATVYIPLDRRQQGRTSYLQLVTSSSLRLGLRAPDPYWTRDNQTTDVKHAQTLPINIHFPFRESHQLF